MLPACRATYIISYVQSCANSVVSLWASSMGFLSTEGNLSITGLFTHHLHQL